MDQPRTIALQGEWVVAFDGHDHRIIRDGAVAYRGDRIVAVGPASEIVADEVIPGRRKLVIPGLISLHAHLRLNEGYRMVLDGGRRDFMRAGFINYAGRKEGGGPAFLDPGDPLVALRFCMATHLLSGVTTILEMDAGAPDGGESCAALAAECGLRMYYAPNFTGADYRLGPKGEARLVWDEGAGLAGLDRALAFAARHDGAAEGRIRPILVLNEFFASTPRLRAATREAATRHGLRITTHFCEQLYEFHETLRQTGLTPALLLKQEGFLGPDVILGHALYVAGHSMAAYPYAGDLEAIAEAGSHIAHCPVAYARRGVAFEGMKRFRDAGINIGLGTDAFPTDIISEMRMAALAGKLVERNHEDPSAADAFRAGTLGGARALGRDDLGRLAPGARADIVVVDFDNLTIGPVLDPIRALVYSATGDMVERVVVDGITRVADKRLLPWNQEALLCEAVASADRVWGGFAAHHWSGRAVDQVFPPAFAAWDGR